MDCQNLYHRRQVANDKARACYICQKPSTTVLTTPDKSEPSDWFYICPGHLKDRGFAIPKDDKAQHDKELDKEIETVKKEFEEKMRKKLDRRKQKEYEKDDKKDGKKDEAKEDAKDEKEKEEKLKELEKKKEAEKVVVEGPRIFELHRDYFQMRLRKKRDAEMAKRNRERLRNVGTFPSVPKGDF